MGKPHQKVLKVNTFGLTRRSRYGLPDRQHRGGPELAKLTPVQLYEGLRGCAIAGLVAHREGEDHDVRVALTRSQRIGLELARRLMSETEVTANEDPKDPPR